MLVFMLKVQKSFASLWAVVSVSLAERIIQEDVEGKISRHLGVKKEFTIFRNEKMLTRDGGKVRFTAT